jgi:hypothetical protein
VPGGAAGSLTIARSDAEVADRSDAVEPGFTLLDFTY